MIDNDRLIKAWEIFRNSNPYEICDGREFRAMREPEYCMGQMIEDTITLLKEQENDIHHMGLIIDEYEKEFKKQSEIIKCKDCKYWRQLYGDRPFYSHIGCCDCDDMWRSLEGETTEVESIRTDSDFYCGYADRR